MKIAIIAPVEETVPPTKYGGIEWIVYHVARGMVEKGHSVDVYASGNSQSSPYHLIPITDKSLRSQELFAQNLPIRNVAKLYSVAQAISVLNTKQYDIIHNNAGWRFLIFAQLLHAPIVTTHHGPLSMDYQNYVFTHNLTYPHISISNNQRKDLPNLNYQATIYNGVDIQELQYFEGAPKDHVYMVFLARMSHEKGAIEAEQVARKTQHHVIVATKIDKVNEEYFAQFKADMNAYVELKGEILSKDRLSLLQNARLLIAPIRWEEPFGLMFTEAMATGTPVVAYARGAAPEIIEDGVTGYLVNESDEFIRGKWTVTKTGVDGLAEAVERIYQMPDDHYLRMRKACRARVEQYFSAQTMINAYEKTFQAIIANRK